MTLVQACFQFRYDHNREGKTAALSYHENIRIYSHVGVSGTFGIEHSSGKTSCLLQQFDIERSYMEGHGSWSGTYDSGFALGRAACLDWIMESIQNYSGGGETWTNSHDACFALGRSVCIYQVFHVDQPYHGGAEQWPSQYATNSPGQANIVLESLDVVRYDDNCKNLPFRFDSVVQSTVAQVFLFETENHATIGFGTKVCGIHEAKTNATVEMCFSYIGIGIERHFEVVSHCDYRMYFHYLAMAATGEVTIDTLNRLPRSFDLTSMFETVEKSLVGVSGRHEIVEAGSVSLSCVYGISNAGYCLVRLQEEAYYEFTASLTNVHTGLVSIIMTTDLQEALDDLEEKCRGDAEWELEYAVTARFYDPDRPNQLRNPVRWRFVTQDGEHWKPGPVVSEVRAIRLPSFMELHFNAERSNR